MTRATTIDGSYFTARAVPELQKLRGVDPSLAPEIDTWIRVLNMNLQDWSLILREKQRQQQAR